MDQVSIQISWKFVFLLHLHNHTNTRTHTCTRTHTHTLAHKYTHWHTQTLAQHSHNHWIFYDEIVAHAYFKLANKFFCWKFDCSSFSFSFFCSFHPSHIFWWSLTCGIISRVTNFQAGVLPLSLLLPLSTILSHTHGCYCTLSLTHTHTNTHSSTYISFHKQRLTYWFFWLQPVLGPLQTNGLSKKVPCSSRWWNLLTGLNVISLFSIILWLRNTLFLLQEVLPINQTIYPNTLTLDWL